jgi:hypothetical protein
MDFQPGSLDYTDLVTATAQRSFSSASSVIQFSGNATWSDSYMATFLAVPNKVEGVANVNLETYRDNYRVPTSSGNEADRVNITYFPQRTTDYELIGIGSELTNTGQQTWQDIDFIVDTSLETAASSFGLGEEHVLEIASKPAPVSIDSQLTPESVVKTIMIEVRGISKKYMNPGLRLKYSLWSYKDPANPVQLSREVHVRPDGISPKDSNLQLNMDLEGQDITYDTLDHCRLRIWSDG